MTKFDNFSKILVEVSEFQIFKSISSPGKKKSPSPGTGRVPVAQKRCATSFALRKSVVSNRSAPTH
jgi:hypothetical protein